MAYLTRIERIQRWIEAAKSGKVTPGQAKEAIEFLVKQEREERRNLQALAHIEERLAEVYREVPS